MQTHPLALIGSLIVAMVLGVSACGARSDLASRAATTGAGGTSYASATGGVGPGPGPTTGDTTGSGGAPQQLCSWSVRFGDKNDQIVSALGVSPGGEPLIAGVFQGEIDLGDQPLSSPFGAESLTGTGTVFLAKLDGSGATEWSRAFASSAPCGYPRLAVDHQGNSVLALPVDAPGATVDFGGGSVGPGTLVAKLDPQGKLLWSHALPDDGAITFQAAIAVDPQGDIILWTIASVGSEYVFELIKLDPQGNPLWTKIFPVQGWGGVMSFIVQLGAGVVTDAQGDIAVTTNGFALQGVESSVDFGGGPLTIPPSAGNAYVAKFDPLGKPIYSRLLGITSGMGDTALKETTLAAGLAGELFITSNFAAPVDVGNGVLPLPAGSSNSLLIARLDPAGTTTWSRLVGEDVYTEALVVTPAGDVVVGGSFRGSLDIGGGLFQTDSGISAPFIARLHGATGEHASSQVFEGEANIDLLSATSDGGLIAAMQLEHSIALCGAVLVSAGKNDVVVAKLFP
jgi:hypothetical protein